MTIIHIHHLYCDNCNNHYKAYDLLSFYDHGKGSAPNLNSEMYDKKCPLCLSKNYTLVKNFEYNLEDAQEEIDHRNSLERQKYNH